MTTREIKEIIVRVDPAAKRYRASKEGEAFTVWGEYRRIMPEGVPASDFGWAFEVDRYVREDIEDDEIAEALERAFAENDRIAFTHEVDYDKSAGYVRHIFDCEGI